MSDHGIDTWHEGLSARERVREIATTLTTSRSVEWVREQAHISSWQTAKDELEMLVEFGQLHSYEGDDGNTKYAPNYQFRYISEITELINEHTRRELRGEIAGIRETIDKWKTTYDVDSRSDLESTLANEALTGADVRDRNRVIRQWEHLDDTIRLLQHALELYDDARSLHLGKGDSAPGVPP